MKPLADYLDDELMDELADCISLEGEAKNRAKPIRDELQRRFEASGETNVERDGWMFNLKREAFSLAWVKRQFGFEQKDLPSECFEEKIEIAAVPEKVSGWLQEQGFEVKPTYTLAVQRKKAK